MRRRTVLALALTLLTGSALAHIGGFRGGGFGGYRGGNFGGYRGYSMPHYATPNYSMPHYAAPRYSTPSFGYHPSYAPRTTTWNRPSYMGNYTTMGHWSAAGRTNWNRPVINNPTRNYSPTVNNFRLGTNRSTTINNTRIGGWNPTVVNRGWERPSIGNRTTVINRPTANVIGSRLGTRTNVNINAPRVTNLAYSSRNVVNTNRFYNRPWGHYYPWYHGGWHGWNYWPRYWGGWGWGYGLGFSTGLAMGSASGLGYVGPTIMYDNPYYVPVPVPVAVDNTPTIIQSSTYVVPPELDYSRPIQVPNSQDVAKTDEDIPSAAKQRMDHAAAAFKRGDYPTAMSECNSAIHLLPGDTNLHEFRALCQFAQKQYKDAAATLYAVLADGPGWDWNTLSSFYPDEATYTKQLRALESFVKENPRDGSGHFVLAYQYLVLDQRAAALEQLQEVVKLQPKDKVSAGLVDALQKDQQK